MKLSHANEELISDYAMPPVRLERTANSLGNRSASLRHNDLRAPHSEASSSGVRRCPSMSAVLATNLATISGGAS